MSLIVQTTALKVVNKGGVRQYQRTSRRVQDLIEQIRPPKPAPPGMDYVIFNCGACSRRNKKPLASALYPVKDPQPRAAFRCVCGIVNEVAPPSRPRPTLITEV